MNANTPPIRATIAVALVSILAVLGIGGCPLLPVQEAQVSPPPPPVSDDDDVVPPPPPPVDDHGDTASDATRLAVDGSSVSGSIEQPGDADFFYFDASAGCTYTIATSGSIDTVLHLYSTDRTTELATDDDGGPGVLSRIEWHADASGRRYVKVRHFRSSGTGDYFVSVSEANCSGGARLIINSDPTSRHVARAISEGQAIFDYWVQRDNSGAIQYISDIRARMPDGREYYFQWDALGRPTFFADASGATVRVHFYIENDQADVEITLPDGTSARGIVDLNELLPSNATARRRSGAFLKDNWQDLSNLGRDDKWTWIAQSLRDDVADFCAAAERVREPVCFASGSLIGALALWGTCAALGALNVPAHGILTTSVLLACGAAVNPTAQEITGAVICEGLGVALEGCGDATREELPEDQPPIPPPTTGTVDIGTGDVHITLTWDNATDVDLHVIDPFGEEIYYAHPRSASGGWLDVDDIDGYGPENIYWPEGEAPTGAYTVVVVYYRDYGLGASNYEVTVRYTSDGSGRSVETYRGTLTNDGERHTITTFTIGSGGGGGSQTGDDHANFAIGATPLSVGGPLGAGQISPAGDVDFFSFEATAGCLYTIETDGDMDTVLHLYASNGTTELAYDDDSGEGLLSVIEWRASSSGTLYVKVRGFGDSTGSYTVSLSESDCGP